jgi:hypothetical protein
MAATILDAGTDAAGGGVASTPRAEEAVCGGVVAAVPVVLAGGSADRVE